MRKTSLLALVVFAALMPAASAAPKIALNVDGQANYSFLAPWANIAGQFDLGQNNTYWTGYIDGDYQTTWTGAAPVITGGNGTYLQVTGAGTGVLHLHHDNPGPNGGGYFQLQLNGAQNLNIRAPDAVAGTPFRKPFLDKVDRLVHGSVIRYMDWMQTVGSNVTNWSDRNTSFSQVSAAGVNYENIVALSNYTKADAWINIPVKASDDYVKNLAKFLKANLNPTLNVHIEYANELWNGGDQLQGTYNLLQARADPMFAGKADDTGKMAARAAEKLRQSVEIFKTEFSGSSRLRPEIGGFIANPYWGQWQIDWLKGKGVNLKGDNYRIAIAPYVPGSTTDLGEVAGDSATTIIAKMTAFMNGNIKTWIGQNKGVADGAGIPLDSYEAAIGSFYGQMNLATHIALQDDPRLGDLEKQFIAMWDQTSGGGLYSAFGLASPYSEWGQWGLLNDINATGSVKYNAVSSLVAPQVGGSVGTGAGVPEPTTIGTIALAAAVLGLRRRRPTA